MGKATYLAAVGLTSIGLLLGQLTAGGQQRQPAQRPATLTPPPSAAWMAASPNPLQVDVSLDQGSSATETIKTRGGEITAIGTDGTRFILTIPNGALSQTTQITMTPVAGIKNLPLSGGLVAAVQISPEDLLFAQAPTLVVRPRAPISPAEQTDFASFAYRGNGKEFHLYPMETHPKRIELKLLHFGGFGIGRGTDGEQEKIRARLPTDSSDRLMMQMQKLKSILRKRLLAKPVAQRAPEEGEWRLVKASFIETEPPQDGELTPQMLRGIVNNLRELYREVMPRVKGLQLQCGPDMSEKMREALEPAQGWLKAVGMLGLTDRLSPADVTTEEKEMLIRDRITAEGLTGRDYQLRLRNYNRGGMVVTASEIIKIERDRLRRQGYTEQEIEDVYKELETVRAEFEKLADDLKRLIWEALQKAYTKAHQCCMQEAKEVYLAMMDQIGQVLSSSGQEAAVSMDKRSECLCTIQSVSAGQSGAWSGEITHTESFVDERDETLGSGTRQNKYYKKHDYEAVINLVYLQRRLVAGEGGSRIPAQVSATGTVESAVAIENRWTSGDMDKRQGSETKLNYKGNVRAEDSDVEVNIRPDGTYSVIYALPCADATGTESTRNYTQGTGFPEGQKNDITRSKTVSRDVCPTQHGVRLKDGQLIGITGQLDVKTTKAISGSKTFEVPLNENPKVNKTITIKWRLKRCK